MDAAAAGGGMQDEAGGRANMVGGFRAIDRGQRDIRFPGGDHRDAVRGQHGAQADGKVEGKVFFELMVREASAAVGTAMSGVNHDSKSCTWS